jgi:membrane protein
MRAAWQEYERDHARYFAAAMVYYALTSLVPVLLLVLAVLGLLLRFADFAAVAKEQVLQTIETSFGAELRVLIESLLDQLEQESFVATVVSLVGLALTASALFRHLRLSFRAIWKYTPPLVAGPVRVAVRASAVEYAMAYVMVLTGGVLLVVALSLVWVTQWLSGLVVSLPVLNRTPAWLLALPSSVIVVGLTFAFLFKFLPPVRLRWRHVWLATALCTVGWVIGAEILVLIGAMFGGSPSASGAIGGLLVLMLWINVVSKLLFFGAEVCKVVSMLDVPLTPGAPHSGT